MIRSEEGIDAMVVVYSGKNASGAARLGVQRCEQPTVMLAIGRRMSMLGRMD
jgi:hypothetical protein